MADRDLSGRTLGEFVLLDKIGQGGFGAVYRSEQPLLKRHVVVKVLRKSDDVAEQRFLREAQLASRFDHPFVAHLYAFGVDETDDLLWLAMELVQGVTLSTWLEQHGPMPLEQFVPFFECIADAVHAAHECGIVHRDLKPSNVMVLERASRLLPKLLDFGIAKTLDQPPEEASTQRPLPEAGAPPQDVATTLRIRPQAPPGDRTATGTNGPRRHGITRTGVAFGSRPYMSPEQWVDAQAVGPASDVYSLGVLAYEALTGRLPFNAESSEELYRLHRNATPPPLGDGLPSDLDRVLGLALAKSPDDRYRSPLEMAAELREAMQSQPREQLRSLARVWNDRSRSPDLLLNGGELLQTPTAVIGDLERAFVTASHRRTARSAWLRRALAATLAALAIGAVWYRGVLETRNTRAVADLEMRAARQVADATITQSELEQGRSALLHGELGAQPHLTEAYRRDPTPATAFMLARAIQPRLAEEARLTSSFGRVWSAVFSPDGKQVVTTEDRGAQIWDAHSYRLLFTLPHGDVVYQAIYTADGSKLITGCGDGAVRIWDTATGELLRELRPAKLKPRYYAIALSADGKLIAGLDLGVAHVWDATTGAVVAELSEKVPSDYCSMAFSADSHWLAMTTGGSAHVFDTQTWTSRDVGGTGVLSVSWDPTGSRLATSSADGSASLWEFPTARRIHHLREFGEAIDMIAFSSDGLHLVAGSRDGTVQVWNASSGQLQSQSNQLHSRVLSVEFDRTSSLVAASGSSGVVAVSEVVSGMPVAVLDGPTGVVRVARFDPTSQRVVGASWDGTARIWDATAPYRRWSTPPVSAACGLITSLQPDQRFVAIRCNDTPTRIWDTEREQLVAELPAVTPVAGDFESAYPTVSTDGDRAAIARGNTVEVYELPSAHLLRTIHHGAPVDTVAFAAAGRDLVSGALDGSVIVTRDNGAQTVLPMSPSSIDAVGFLPDGRVVVTDARQRLRIYDVGGATLADLETHGRAMMLRVAPDGRYLVTVSTFTGKVAAPELWDVEHYRRVAQLASPGQGQVYGARFISNNKIITACGDGAIRMWTAQSGQLQQIYRGGSRFLVDATISTDGTMLIGGGGDGQLRFWVLESGRPVWTMSAHRSHLVGVRVDGDNIITRGFSGDVARWSLPRPEQVIDACSRSERCAIVTQ